MEKGVRAVLPFFIYFLLLYDNLNEKGDVEGGNQG